MNSRFILKVVMCKTVYILMLISFTVTSLCSFKQDDIFKHFLKGLGRASHAQILQNKCQLVDRAGVYVCVRWLPKSLAVGSSWKGVGRRNEWTRNIMTVFVWPKRQKVVSTTPLLIFSPFMFVRDKIDVVLVVTLTTNQDRSPRMVEVYSHLQFLNHKCCSDFYSW